MNNLKEQEAIRYIEESTSFEVQEIVGERTVSVRVGAYTCRNNNRHFSRWFAESTRGEALQEAVSYVTQDQVQCGCAPPIDKGTSNDTRS